MKKLYLILAIIGFAIPNYFVALESIETGNIMLYKDVVHTFEQMFANRISTIFSIDLLFAVMIFFIWSASESKKLGKSMPYWIWGCTMLLGLAGGFPLFLWWKEK